VVEGVIHGICDYVADKNVGTVAYCIGSISAKVWTENQGQYSHVFSFIY